MYNLWCVLRHGHSIPWQGLYKRWKSKTILKYSVKGTRLAPPHWWGNIGVQFIYKQDKQPLCGYFTEMKKLTKFERELSKMIFELARKYGYKDIGTTGTIDPKWYKCHIKGPSTPGLIIQFVNYKEQ